MDVDQFYQSRQADWKALSELVERGRSGAAVFSPQEIHRLGSLYRAATSDLAVAQRDYPRHQINLYLNQLVGRSHALLYRQEPVSLRRIANFLRQGLPRLYRQTLPFTAVAAATFFIAALTAGIVLARTPEAGRWLLPPSVYELHDSIAQKELWVEIPVNERPYASSFIMQNNIQVSFFAFGSGALAGVFTIWLLIVNGLILGGLTGMTIHYGIGFELWNFVIGHGVIELSVIAIAAGTGLMLGWAVVHPGLQRRRDALASAAGRAVRLLIGCVPLLVIAGLIEGLISPAENIHWGYKWGLGIASGLLMHGYLLLAGREKVDVPALY